MSNSYKRTSTPDVTEVVEPEKEGTGVEPQQPQQQQQPAQSSSPPASTSALRFSTLGWVSLGCLVVQNSALTLTMRASRLSTEGKPMYLATSAVVACELIKLFLSFIMLIMEKGSISGMLSAVQNDILSNPSQNLYLLIPSALYTIQNNLQYFAASHLDPATFQVLYQMKLITTALLSVVMLNRQLSYVQWASVFILTAGIGLVQTSEQNPSGVASSTQPPKEGQFVGFIAVLTACCTSAAAGVYLEKLVKQTRPSVWIRNIQLAVFGLIVGLFGCYLKDWEKINEGGFLQGFTSIVWVVVLLQSFGGILIAVVVKYADNIIKGFATGLSIISSATASVYLFGFVVTAQYIIGASTVIVSVYMYSVNSAGPLGECIDAAFTSAVPSPNDSVPLKSPVIPEPDPESPPEEKRESQ